MDPATYDIYRDHDGKRIVHDELDFFAYTSSDLKDNTEDDHIHVKQETIVSCLGLLREVQLDVRDQY